MNWKNHLLNILYILIGSGIGTFIVQKLFEHRLNKKLYRFTKLFSDKVDAIRILYRFLVRSEKALYTFLSQKEPSDLKEKAEFKMNTVEILNEFIQYFEENELLFEEDIVTLLNQIIEKIKKAKIVQSNAEIFESDRGSEAWTNAVLEKQDLLEKTVEIEIPRLKEKLKIDFQKKYHLLSK